MSKRGASTELTDKNWDQEEEPEEAGEFSRASEDQMKARQILKARRNPAQKEGGPSAFAGFGGFFKPSQTSTPLFAGGSYNKTESKIPASERGEKREEEQKDNAEGSPAKRAKVETNGHENGSDSNAQDSYLSNLKALNMSVFNWIKQHLEKNAYCVLTPIFKDYENHLAELESKRKVADGNGNAEMKKEVSVMDTEEKPAPKTGLTIGMGNLSAAKEMSVSQPPSFSGFSFKPSSTGSAATGSGFSFAVGSSKPSTSEGGGDQGEEEYVPPPVETVEHKEEGSLYSKKCKLFYQKEGAWTERGVGFLHLKKTDGKAQLLVRADTTLGNILLNVRLSESMPLSRQGKNNVSLMSIINPPIPKVSADKPVPMLIRVKTTEDADELLEKMKEVRS